MPSFIDKTGAQQEVILGADIFKRAKDANLTVRQYINRTYETAAGQPETFVQMCESEGLFMSTDAAYGINSTPMNVILDPPIGTDAASTTRENPVQSRILFPPMIISAIESAMAKDRMTPASAFDSMVAITTTVPTARTVQPVISYAGKDGPEDLRAQQISQLSEPANMMLITASETARAIPTFSLGLAVSDQAMQYTTLDMVALAITRQKEIEMFSLAGESVMAMLNGDDDNGQSALVQTKADTLDTTISAAGTLTQKAWMAWLYSNLLQRQITHVIVDSITTATAIENRTGKPVITTDDPNSERLDTTVSMIYPNLAASVKIFVAPTEWSMTANTIMGFQQDSAIAKYINSNATYESSERWALRRGEAVRMDFGQMYFRLFDEAFSVLSLTLTA